TTGASQMIRQKALPGSSSSFAATNLVAGHSYRWYLRSYDAQNHTSPWSSGVVFTLSPTPQQLYPEGPVSDLLPAFHRSAVGGATHYELYVSDTTTGTLLLDNANISATSFTPPTPLIPGHRYQWWVRALDASNKTYPWSAGDSFTEAPVPTPVTLGPRGS